MGSQRLNEGTLFVVATPIGNLDDMSPRAREVLRLADLIAAEDTRVTGRLLSNFGIKTPQIALHEHNEESLVERLIGELLEGKSIALVSDAGTPLISDPGYRLLTAAHQAGIRVSPVPGASALVAALSVSGLPTDRFAFEGFLPAKKAARMNRLESLVDESRTTVFYESVHRVADVIADMIRCYGGGRLAFVGRELTKLHEQCVTAELATIATMLEDGRIPAKGEFVVAVRGSEESRADRSDVDVVRLLEVLTEAVSGKQAVELAARISGKNRNELYRRMLELKSGNES
jgi:16S rRNA (cytidine1402-2'-O)-methyltransferase